MRQGSWTVRRGSWVVSCTQVLRLTEKKVHTEFLNKAIPVKLFSSKYQNGLMSVKRKSESRIHNVMMFDFFFLKSLDALCRDYLIIVAWEHSHMIGQKLIFLTNQKSICS